MSDVEITVWEVARVALADPSMRRAIGEKIDLSDEWLEQVRAVLEREMGGSND